MTGLRSHRRLKLSRGGKSAGGSAAGYVDYYRRVSNIEPVSLYVRVQSEAVKGSSCADLECWTGWWCRMASRASQRSYQAQRPQLQSDDSTIAFADGDTS